MKTTKLNPEDINLNTEFNERTEGTAVDKELIDSISSDGILTPPTVRKTTSGYDIVCGKRRVAAAVELGIEEIDVIVSDVDDYNSLKNSVTENHFRKNTTPTERVNALTKLWGYRVEGTPKEKLNPSARKIGELTGISPRTIQTWLEATNTTWEDTVIEKEIEGDSDTDFYNQLGENKAGVLRRGVDKHPDDWESEDIDELVQWAAESELSITQCKEAAALLSKGADTQMAMEAVTNELVEETHAKLDGKIEKVTGEYTQSLEEEESEVSDEEEDSSDEDIEKIKVAEQERTSQWLEEVEDAENNYSNTPEPSEESELSNVSSFEISFTVDDENLVSLMKVAMDELGYDDPNLLTRLALDRFLTMRENEIANE